VRVIALARTAEIARGALTEALVAQMRHVLLRPLAYRTVKIDQLLDRMLAERNATQRTADLTRTNRAALRAYDWPRNLAELRQIADGLAAHAATGGLRPAAKFLGRPHQSLGNHFARVGLTFPLFGS
jgi:DNA-binding NtrC family response regulator